jgi:hypothetical protein
MWVATCRADRRTRASPPDRTLLFACDGYAADHGGYAGMTLAGLRKYDAGIADITIVLPRLEDDDDEW